ncbi:hypothetical protein [Bifidobacterium sp.]|jgi:hypothetical protein|uniref:hypothetical protein n=1 Tax=Bifidobacterium sp. TaxID=41200 RepID=UPI0025BCF7E4|nr:hypothetical protein [Bifidobacterium sp.]MCH4208932.1 hypothetical protein [Bifidobacterium sp.]MCI1224479.1 hypothetical protein [Bifidobacterium sp.]
MVLFVSGPCRGFNWQTEHWPSEHPRRGIWGYLCLASATIQRQGLALPGRSKIHHASAGRMLGFEASRKRNNVDTRGWLRAGRDVPDPQASAPLPVVFAGV